MSANEKKGNGKVIAVLGIALVMGVVVLVIALFSMMNGNNETTDLYETTQTQNNQSADTTATTDYTFFQENTTVIEDWQDPQVSVSTTQQGDSDTSDETTIIDYYEQLSPNGDNKLSDNPDNEFIRLVVEEYGVKEELLVAIYSVPDTGTNYVLEFAGSRDKNGNIVKSPDTLSKLYHIDQNKNIKVASRSGIGNVGVDSAEGLLSIELVKKLVMSQYPDYFTGIE